MPAPTHQVAADGSWILCLCYKRTSYHPMDVKRLYCGCCNQFHPIRQDDQAATPKTIRWWVCRNRDAQPNKTSPAQANAEDSQYNAKPIPGLYMLLASHDRPKMSEPGFWLCQPNLPTDIRVLLGPADIAEAALPFNLRAGMCREVDIKLTPIPRPSSNR